MAEYDIMAHSDILSILTSEILAMNYGSIWKTWMCLSKQHYAATLAFPNAKVQLANRRATLELLCDGVGVSYGSLPARSAHDPWSVEKKYVTIHTNIKNYCFGEFEDITFHDVINNPKLKYAYHLLPKNKNFSAEDVDKLYKLGLIKSTDRVSYHGISLEYLTKRNLLKNVRAILKNHNVTAEIVHAIPMRPDDWKRIPARVAKKLGVTLTPEQPGYYKYVDLSTISLDVRRIYPGDRQDLAKNKTLTYDLAKDLYTQGYNISNPDIVMRLYEQAFLSFNTLAATISIPWTYVYEQYLLHKKNAKSGRLL